MTNDMIVLAGGGGDSKEPVRTPDGLLSQDYFELVLAISEGPIKGHVYDTYPMENFYADSTAAIDSTGRANFSDFSALLYAGKGEDADKPITFFLGGTSANVPINVALSSGIPVTRSTPPVQRGNFNRLEVRIRFDYMAKTTADGQFNTNAQLRIEYRQAGVGAWKLYENTSVINVYGKTSSGYVRDFVIGLPESNFDYDIRVTKLSADGVQGVDEDVVSMSWESYQVVKTGTAQFKDVAFMHIYGKASNQFTSVPEFSGVFDGIICRVPTNYNPITRVYDETTPWNGTFKDAWTNNPVWVLYELITNERWGLSRYYKAVTANRYEFYAEAKWCDQMVPDGRGGTQPRFTYNDWITEPRDGKEMLSYVAGAFNAVLDDDGNGTVILRSDRPRAARQMFTPENVTPSGFNYSFADPTTRYNDIQVAFVNPDLGWEQDWRPATIDNTAEIAKFGRVPFQFVAVGCTDAWEAVRRANYRYVTATQEVATTNFTTSRIGLTCGLLDTIYVADPLADWGITGRIKSATNAVIQLRDPLYFATLASRTIKIQTYDGIVQRTIAPGIVGENYSLNVVGANFPVDTIPEKCTFIIEDTVDIGLAKPFRVLAIEEVEGKPDEVAITAVEIAVGKYEQVESGSGYIPSQYSYVTPGEARLPSNFTLRIPLPAISKDGSLVYSIEASWQRGLAANAGSFEIDFKIKDDSTWRTIRSYDNGAVLTPVRQGARYLVRLYSVSPTGLRSQKCLEQEIVVTAKNATLELVASFNYEKISTGYELTWSLPETTPDYSGTDIRMFEGSEVGEVLPDYFDLTTLYREKNPPVLLPWQLAGVKTLYARYTDTSGNHSKADTLLQFEILPPAVPTLELETTLGGTYVRFSDPTTTQPLKTVHVRTGGESSTWATATDAGSAGATQRSLYVRANAAFATKVYVRAEDLAGNLGPVAVATIPPAAEDIQKLIDIAINGVTLDSLADDFLDKINLIDAPASVNGSVTQRIETAIEGAEANFASVVETIVTGLTGPDGPIGAYVQDYAYSKTQTNSAIAGAIETFAATIGDNSELQALIQQEANVRAEADGHLGAQWALRVSLTNGGVPVVGGMAVSGTSNGTTGSRFDIAFRSNTVAFLPPTGDDTKYEPFVYYTTPTVVNGVTVPAGLYLKSAFIDHVRAAQIDTRGLTIKDNSGNIIFGVGQNLDSSRINASASWQNGNIYISGGSLYGIGGGSGTAVENSQLVPSINSAATTANWNGVSGTGRPQDYATYGARWNSTISNQPSDGTIYNNQIGINGSGQFYNASTGQTGIPVSNNQLSLSSDGRLYTGGSQLGSQVTPGGIGAVNTSGSNAPSILRNDSISLTVNSNGTISVSGGPSSSGQFTGGASGLGAMAYINAITSLNVSTYIAAAAIDYTRVGVLQAANLSVVALKDTINGGVTSAGRIDISTKRIDVYDDSNWIRVRLGML